MARIRKLIPHIRAGSHMIDEGEKSHVILKNELSLTRETHKTAETKGLDDEKNPMNTVNTVHRFFKKFMRSHGSYSRGDCRTGAICFPSSSTTAETFHPW